MSPEPLDAAIRRRMQTQRRRDTGLELALRRRLHADGYRFRVDYRPEASLRCRGDIVFTRAKVVVFVDGCFWHGCPDHGTTPTNNAAWWREKLAANIARDLKNTKALVTLGWTVVRIWEHEQVNVAVLRVKEAITAARPP